MTDTREAFEKAVENDFEKPTFTAMERDGYGYIDGYVDNAWWGWQAATEQAQARIAEYQIAMDAIRAFACMHPRPSQVNKAQACEMLNISRPTLNAWIKDGKIKLNKCGLISVTEIDRLLSV